MRTIDADALMEKICGNCQQKDCVPDATDTVYGCIFAESIDQMPTIEPERRHGRWIVRGQEIYCSECNEESLYNPFGASKFSRFCPNCGANMMEVRADETN